MWGIAGIQYKGNYASVFARGAGLANQRVFLYFLIKKRQNRLFTDREEIPHSKQAKLDNALKLILS
ncbi:hypothetical protein GCM10020331_078710 [Ectobacillus funiculus]